jgi:competence protein ComEC
VGARGVERLSFSSAPALYAALWLSAGIVLSPYWWLEPGILIAATLLLAMIAGLAAAHSNRVALLPLACSWMLLGVLLSEVEPAPDPQSQLRLIADSGGSAVVEGRVTRTTPVRVTQSSLPFGKGTRQEQSESLDLRVASANGLPVAGGLRATLYDPVDQALPAIHCGDKIHALVAMRPPERYLDPGAWDATAWLRQQGIGVVGSLKASNITVTPGRKGGSFPCWLHSVQQAGSQRLIDFSGKSSTSRWPRWLLLNYFDAGMLSAMILGDRTYLDHQARVGFERTGSFHLLVVSGMHLAIFAGCIFALAGLLRLPRVWSTAVTIGCSFAYALLAGFGEPVQRSFWMVTLYLLARLLFRQKNSLNAIGFAALCLLALDPRSLQGASFQMTLLSVLIVAGVAAPVAEHTFGPYLHAARNLGLVVIDPDLPPRLAQFRVTLRLVAFHLQPFFGSRMARTLPPFLVRVVLRSFELLLVSALIELAMSLPMAIYFHRVTALGLPVNLLVVPLIGLALPSALITFACLLVWPAGAIWPGAVTAALLHSISGIVQLFSAMGAGDIRIPNPGNLAIAAGILLIGISVWAARNSRFPVWLPIAALACSAACVFYPRALAREIRCCWFRPRERPCLSMPGARPAAAPRDPAATSRSAKTWSRRYCGPAISVDSTRLLLPTRTAITWAACLPCCGIFVPGCFGWGPTLTSRPTTRCWLRHKSWEFPSNRWPQAALLASAVRRSRSWLQRLIMFQAPAPAITIRWSSMWLTDERPCCWKAMPRRPARGRCFRRCFAPTC